jgi:hypothetical protein
MTFTCGNCYLYTGVTYHSQVSGTDIFQLKVLIYFNVNRESNPGPPIVIIIIIIIIIIDIISLVISTLNLKAFCYRNSIFTVDLPKTHDVYFLQCYQFYA